MGALEAACCPGDAERCTDPHHGAAFVAWDLLEGWGRMTDEERWDNRGLLEHTLAESRVLTEEHAGQVLGAANCPAGWDDMIGWLRDPPFERHQAARTGFVEAVCASSVPGEVGAGGP